MSGTNFRVKGTAGAAPNTIYFATVPDRLSVMGQGNFNSGTGINATKADPANLVSLWTLYNTNMLGGSNVVTSSFGASTSAPDGTTNGIKLVESATNTIHACECTFITQSDVDGFPHQISPYTMRMSVFAKAAERTRFALYFGSGKLDQNNGGVTGCKTIFDLSGGQIGVANTAFGSPTFPFVPGPTEITSFPNGWFRCTMDVGVGSTPFGLNFPGYIFGILLDSGSGTGADSTSYSGDGSSGAYFWRSTSLPPAAWALNNVTFFDDFTSLSTIDLNDTRAPGFNWYIHGTWPNFPSDVGGIKSQFSLSSPSVLKQTAPSASNPSFGIPLASAASNGNTSPTNGPITNCYVGTVFQPSMLFESLIGWNGSVGSTASTVTLWTQSIEGVVEQPQLNAHEVDFFEFNPGGATTYPLATVLTGVTAQVIMNACSGYPIWYSTFTYNSNGAQNSALRAADGSQLYTSIITNNLNNQPSLNVGTDWSTFSLQGFNIPYANQHYIDWIVPKVMSTLWLSSIGNDAGHILMFFDGRYCGACNDGMTGGGKFGHWSYSDAPTGGDRLHYPIFTGSPNNQDVYYDWIKVTQ